MHEHVGTCACTYKWRVDGCVCVVLRYDCLELWDVSCVCVCMYAPAHYLCIVEHEHIGVYMRAYMYACGHVHAQ
jgi:hypothetical protein